MSNPFQPGNEDVDEMAAILADGSRAEEAYRLMIAAGYTPEKATECLTRLDAFRLHTFGVEPTFRAEPKRKGSVWRKVLIVVGVVFCLFAALWLAT